MAEGGFHNLGLELSQAEGDLWKVDFGNSPEVPEEIEGWIECLRCHQRLKIPIPQAGA